MEWKSGSVIVALRSEPQLEPSVVSASASRNADALDVVAIQSLIASGTTPAYAVEQLNLARSQSVEPPLGGRLDFTGSCQRFAMDLASVEAQAMRLSALGVGQGHDESSS